MSSGSGGARLRAGRKSCTECRKRKTRCLWAIAGANRCAGCEARDQPCVAQSGKEPSRIPSRTVQDRLGFLEREVASLSALVRNQPLAHPLSPEKQRDGDDYEAATVSSGSDADEGLENVDSPAHLQLLFSGLAEKSDQRISRAARNAFPHINRPNFSKPRLRLQELLPPAETVTALVTYAEEWKATYHALFPAVSGSEHIVDLSQWYREMQQANVHPVRLAKYLLYLAITVQQLPLHDDALQCLGVSAQDFVSKIIRRIERTVVKNSGLVRSIEGLETSLLFARVELGRGNFSNFWMTLRSIIAAAELIGLPRASRELNTPKFDQPLCDTNGEHQTIQAKADLWDAICATDRNASMMLNMPPGTIAYEFPKSRDVVSGQRVLPHVYNYHLSDICAAVYKLDHSYTCGVSAADIYADVLHADRELRILAATPPKAWWTSSKTASLAERMVQFWHYYLQARVHLRLAMSPSADEQYVYSRIVCRKSCREALHRFVDLRHAVPAGFFVCRVVDVQAFTAAVVLLFAGSSTLSDAGGLSSQTDPEDHSDLIQQAIDTFLAVLDRPGSELASEAVAALSALSGITRRGSTASSEPIELQVPMLGRIRISRRLPASPLPTASPASDTVEQSGVGHELDTASASGGAADTVAGDAWLFDLATETNWFNDELDMTGVLGLGDWLDESGLAE